MDSVTINIIEQVDDISINVTNEVSNVEITVLEQPNNIEITAVNTYDQVVVEVTQSVAQVTINVVEGTSGGGGAVDSVNGQTGTVVLDTSDISETTDKNYTTDAQQVVLGNTSGENNGDQESADFNHGALQNTHNLTTDINHGSITNTHNLTTDIDHNQITNTHNLTTDIDHGQITNTHNLTTDIDHNQLTNYAANRHFLESEISIPASQVSDFDTEVANNTAVALNTNKNSYPTADETKLGTIEESAEVNNISDVNATALTDGGETTLHNHAGGGTPPLIWLNGGAGGGPTSDATNTILSINWVIQKYIDTGTFTHSTSTNATRIYVDVDGTYEVNYTLYLTGANGIARVSRIKKSSVLVPQWQNTTRPTDPYSPSPHQLGGIVELTAGQYIEVETVVVFPGGVGTSSVGASSSEIYVTKIK